MSLPKSQRDKSLGARGERQIDVFRSSRIAFQLLAIYAVAMGFVGLPVGLFVGPHLLFAAFGHLLVGVSAAVAYYGLRRRAPWGWWAGVAVSVTIIIVSTIAIRELLSSDGGLPAGVFFAISGMLFTAVLVDLIRS